MKKKTKTKGLKIKVKKPAIKTKRRKVNKIRYIGVEATVAMLKGLLAGEDVKAVTFNEKRVKAELLKDIALAKKEGYQIEIPCI